MTRSLKTSFARGALVLVCALTLSLLASVGAHAQAKRLVLLKVDGLPHDEVERFVRERDPRTGKSRLPWIDHVFYKSGTRLANFYTRGMSLSGPSWSLIDTGQHLQIKGNVEFDRYTLHSYDYLNFIPFWIANVGRERVDMPGPELLDEVGVPLLIDAYPYNERFVSFQLHQRGLRWTTLQRGLQNRFTSRSPGELFSEWNIGIDARSIIFEQQERELMEKLADPRVRYLDLYTTDFDHAAHHNRDRESHLVALRELDGLVGRLWMAIRKSALAEETAFVLISDHGFNSNERVYSQGYNLVTLLASAAGGGHHVVTKRRVLNDYALKGIYPLISLVYATTKDSFYLKGRSAEYPTALVDFDGNERASIHLRDSDLNVVHILLQQLRRKELPADVRRAATSTLFATIDRRRPDWQRTLGGLNEEVAALGRLIAKQRAAVAATPKKFTREQQDAGAHNEAIRQFARLDSWLTDEREYTEFARTLSNLLALRPDGFDPSRLNDLEFIAKGAMGDSNNVERLQNYVVGPAPGGLALDTTGALDLDKSFQRVNYLDLLASVAVRNNVQPGVGSRPVDFVAVRVPASSLAGALANQEQPDEAVLLHAGRDTQALILSRRDNAGRLRLRYLPVANLRQSADGSLTFEAVSWRAGLPLKLWEDARLDVPAGESRESWLSGWHTDLEWLRAAHRTLYSTAVVGIQEQFGRHHSDGLDADSPELTPDDRLIRRFRRRQRVLVEPDLQIFAADHWNFDLRGFNPGGNHGSFFRVSTHSTLMLAGGERTGIPRAAVVEQPYDSLSFMPTMLALTGQLNNGQTPVPVLWQKGFRRFPGRVIDELFQDKKDVAAPIAHSTQAGDSP
ncbi:MAG TPA: alkaline phosphatase family protein [Pyrinomonadaceae bacterium]